ncbi:unnamed protein product [Rotaria socialis]|uniref:Uncharacterized protein n=1 Tax=Rotaria socialis TaxID=392032 RepID=A0A821EFK3_9BILA|nr:unnamed protein product [Rotaria socialis]CAF3447202.1 unnamed protein product [Rotaria socialis]CAF4418104.1 unnamed protein product [Rotaria socialis]CAF4488254.1 unnamed protein product [Rotaria socialis]CAF4635618.1 unnamed protein product [Rotaria socialis]
MDSSVMKIVFSTIQKRQGAFYVAQPSFSVESQGLCDDACQEKAGALLEAEIPVRVTQERVVLNNVIVTY